MLYCCGVHHALGMLFLSLSYLRVAVIAFQQVPEFEITKAKGQEHSTQVRGEEMGLNSAFYFSTMLFCDSLKILFAPDVCRVSQI